MPSTPNTRQSASVGEVTLTINSYSTQESRCFTLAGKQTKANSAVRDAGEPGLRVREQESLPCPQYDPIPLHAAIHKEGLVSFLGKTVKLALWCEEWVSLT